MLTPGQTLSHYTILGLLGEGGMGQIYRARDTRLQRDVALKILHADAIRDPDRRRRFIQEARAASALNHPHIVTVYDIDEAATPDGDVDFIAMELVAGGSLAQRIGSGLSVADTLRSAIQIAEALAAAHEAGVIHRDLKPANIMMTAGGMVKVVDFGLAKLLDTPGATGPATTVAATAPGAVLGTLSYMAPEQIEGGRVDARSDLFAFGSILYELLTGRRPFERDSQMATVGAILSASPPSLTHLRRDVPADLTRIVGRCLQRDPDARYPSAAELRADLQACQARLAAPASLAAAFRRPRVLVPAALFLIAAIGTGGWLWNRSARARHARTVVLPEIERLAADMEFSAALRLAMTYQGDLAGDPTLARLWDQISMPVTIRTTPEGARLSMRSYRGGDWVQLGTSPVLQVRVPSDNVRYRVEKEGYEPLEFTSAIVSPDLALTLEPSGGAHTGMVRVLPGPIGVGALRAVTLPEYWIDRYEVTNRQFKRFVDAGGYERRDLWKHPFVTDGKTLNWEAAMARLRDRTGRPGPSTWQVGTYPAGADDLPVNGVSWYEAAAYAEFAGASLPTFYHWFKAAGLGRSTAFFSDIVRQSNFGSSGPVRAGSLEGISAYGAYDMAGNVKEWCVNEAPNGQRFALGGGWGEPEYLFGHADAHPAFERGPRFGMRIARFAAPPDASLLGAVKEIDRDFAREQPVSDDVFKAYAGLYAYDKRADLAAKIEDVDESSAIFRKERVSIAAAYDGQRVPLYLLLPRRTAPPYQTLVYFPSGESIESNTSQNIHRDWRLEIVLQSGRAVAHPVYRGTYERRTATPTSVRGGLTIHQFQDLARSIDYLETRPEIDHSRLGYYGSSYGASRSPIMLAMEPRLKAAVLLWGGFSPKTVDVAEPFNFAPRVTVPVLMVNGRNDFIFPVDTAQLPLLRYLGTPEAHKRHVLFDYGHIPPKNEETIKEVLDWLDRYLGPVN